MTDFGCDYCQDDQNRLFGHVTQIASDEARRMILLQCPRCSSLYENTPDGPDQTRRLSEAEACSFFPEFARAVRQVESVDGLQGAVARFIEAQNDPAFDARNKALGDIGLLLERLVRENGLPDDESLGRSVDGLAPRRVAVTNAGRVVEITGSFSTLVTRDGRTGELMLPMHARLSAAPETVSTMRVAGRESLFEPPKSEREFQRAFDKAIWAYTFELRSA